MSYAEAKELAELRHALRTCLVRQDVRAATGVLARLRAVVGADLDLRAEYERWSFRFELLAA
jgi:hypothetical protein